MSRCIGFDTDWKSICNEPEDCRHCIFYECESLDDIKKAYDEWLKECNDL